LRASFPPGNICGITIHETVMLNVKVDAVTKARIESVARLQGITVSEFVRRELKAAVARVAKGRRPTAWELLEPFCGRFSGTDPDRSSRRAKDAIRARYLAKHPR
jgi:hypothetical protein